MIDFTKPLEILDTKQRLMRPVVQYVRTGPRGLHIYVRNQLTELEMIEFRNYDGAYKSGNWVLQNRSITHVREFWVNFYPGSAEMHTNRGKADEYADYNRIACVHFRREFNEGEGL
jgi:hypothetical protein